MTRKERRECIRVLRDEIIMDLGIIKILTDLSNHDAWTTPEEIRKSQDPDIKKKCLWIRSLPKMLATQWKMT